jgi:hypothetical protein
MEFDDLCQEVRLRVSRRLPHHSRFTKAADFVGWIIKLTRSIVLKRLEGNRVESEQRAELREAAGVGVDDLRIAFIAQFGSINDDLLDQVLHTKPKPVSRTHPTRSTSLENLRQEFLQTEST